MATKQQIRAEAKRIRNGMPYLERQEKSKRICRTLGDLIKKNRFRRICFYYPLGSEADILPLAGELLSQGAEIAFPKVYGEDMRFIQVTDLNQDFKEGAFHIMEPVSDREVDWQDACVLAPGLSFDGNGNRIGYGKGYYDRYFTSHSHGPLIGVSFEAVMAENIIKKIMLSDGVSGIPFEEHDLRMDMICTENRLLMLRE